MTDAETKTEVVATPEAAPESVVPAADPKDDKAKDGGSWFGGCCGLSGDAKDDKGKSPTEAPATPAEAPATDASAEEAPAEEAPAEEAPAEEAPAEEAPAEE